MLAGALCKPFAEPFLTEIQGLSAIGRSKRPVFRLAMHAHLRPGWNPSPEPWSSYRPPVERSTGRGSFYNRGAVLAG